MDAITMLKNDHKTVEQLFKRFEKAGDKAFVEKRTVVDRIIEELSVHAAIEELVFYPVIRATVPTTDDLTLEALEEHHIVEWVLAELERMNPEDERYDAKVTVLIENVRHHVEEEEQDLFPMVRDELGRNALSDLGEAMAAARKIAPTHPHPHSPDTPPGNLVLGTAAGVADRIGDTVSGLAQGSMAAVGDLVDTILQRKKPRRSPRGSSTARRTAAQVRTGAADATDAAIEATRKATRKAKSGTRRAKAGTNEAGSRASRTAGAASRGSSRTARAAKAGAKSTVTTARKSTTTAARATKTAAKRAATTTGRTAKAAAKTTKSTASKSTASRSTASRSTAKRAARR